MNAPEKVRDAVAALAPMVRSAAAETERTGRLPPSIVTALTSAGVFKLCVPRALGGSEADAETLLSVLETLGAADGSTGWCAMIGATTGLVAGYLDDAEARTIFGPADVIAGGVFAPHGRAVRDGSDVIVSGRWPFASGSSHAAWLMGGAVIVPETSAGAAPSAASAPRMVIFPARAATIHDTWQVSGLRGTASNDIEVRDLRVPYARTVSLGSDRPRADGALYRFPAFGLLALGIAAVALGIARGAGDDFRELAEAKTPTGSRRAAARARVGAGRCRDGRGRSGIGALLPRRRRRALWTRSREGRDHRSTRARGSGSPRPTRRGRPRARSTSSTKRAAAPRSTQRSPLQRRFRDVHVTTQHLMVAPATYELVGRLILGLETDTSTL